MHGHTSANLASVVHLLAVVVGVTLTATSCRPAPDRQNSQESLPSNVGGVNAAAFRELFDVVDSVVLEEAANVVTLFPSMFMDEQGGFLVAESLENQVREYSASGRLVQLYGSGGSKADSIRAPAEVARRSNGDIVVANGAGYLTIIPADSAAAVRYVATPARALTGLSIVSETDVLLVGSYAPYPAPLLHVWDAATGAVKGSFFSLPKGQHPSVAQTFGFVKALSRNGRVVVMHALSDSLYVFSVEGVPLARIGVQIENYKAPTGPLPRLASRQERQEWAERYTFVSRLFWRDNEKVIVQWSRGGRNRTTYGLVAVDLHNQRQWSLSSTPRLLGIREGRFFFQDPESSMPNRIVIAVQKERGSAR